MEKQTRVHVWTVVTLYLVFNGDLFILLNCNGSEKNSIFLFCFPYSLTLLSWLLLCTYASLYLNSRNQQVCFKLQKAWQIMFVTFLILVLVVPVALNCVKEAVYKLKQLQCLLSCLHFQIFQMQNFSSKHTYNHLWLCLASGKEKLGLCFQTPKASEVLTHYETVCLLTSLTGVVLLSDEFTS